MNKSILYLTAAIALMIGNEQQAMAKEIISVSGRNIEINDSGQVIIQNSNGESIGELSYAFFVPTWWLRNNQNATDVKIERSATENRVAVQGSIPLPKPATRLGSFKQQIAWDEQKLTLDLELELPHDVTLMTNSRPFMQLSIPMNLAKGKRISMGEQTVDLPAHNAHGWGDKLSIEGIDIVITTSKKASISSWGQLPKSTHASLRLDLVETPGGDAEKLRYTSHMTIEFKKVDLKQSTPRDLWAERAGNYRRLLINPNEQQLETAIPLKWLASAETAFKSTEARGQAQKEAEKHYSQVENWLDLRSRVYDLYDQQRHLGWFSSIHPLSDNLQKGVDEAYALLNAGDLDALSTQLPEWEQHLSKLSDEAVERYGSPFLPAITPNPYGWIKEYSTLGFRKHPEGVLNLEPSPMNVSWFDGISVQWIKNGQKTKLSVGDESYADVIWEKPSSISTERSWVTTEWIHDATRFTASVLSPLLDMSGSNVVELSGLQTASKLTYLKKNAVLRHVDLKKQKSIRFDEEPSARNWLLLQGDQFAFAIILGSTPTEVTFEDGVLRVAMRSNSFVSLVRLSPLIQSLEHYREADFWGRVALALPIQAVETITKNVVTYHYLYLERTDDWGTSPLRIAPVPPLAVNGHVTIPGIQNTSYHTKYGLYAYLVGDTVSMQLPDTFMNRVVLRGVNVAAKEKEAEIVEFATNGVDWVRVFIQTTWDDPETAYSTVEAQLGQFRKLGIKALLDPHNFQYKTDWGSGMPTDPEEENRFLVMWDRLSQIGARNRDVVAGYDLYNELYIKPGSFSLWAALAQRAIGVIRANDPETPIYITGSDMANTSGYFDSVPLDDPATVHSFHFYTPHSFSHQMIQSRGRSGSAYLFYPGWITPMDWKQGTHFGEGALGWYDRWSIGAAMLPVFEFQTRYNLPMHCGEFGVVGYANPKAPVSGRLWTRDTVDWLERYRINWNIWNMGFGLRHPGVKADIYQRWDSDENSQKQ